MSDNSTILLIGGAETGKSNYIFRLWLAINDGEGCLTRDSLPDELQYLRAGAQTLLGGEFAQRTPRGTYAKVEIPFRTAVSNEASKLVVPDISGEDCEKIFIERRWSSDWEDNISSCVGCLVFLRERVLNDPSNWVEVGPLILANHTSDPTAIISTHSEASRSIPTQSFLVEWLQFVHHALTDVRGASFIPRVAVVVAAWDEIGDEIQEQGPDAFVEEYTPLLFQYIEGNQRNIDVKIFGSSIVGGDLSNDPKFRDQYLEGDPHRSGFITYMQNGELKKSPDIALPVGWILGVPFM